MPDIVLPGTIVPYGGSSDSLANLELNGWLLCDGSLYNINRYQRLFAAIGTSWGGDGANQFAVPDLRGLFLRGVSANSNVDPDALTRNRSRPELNGSGNGGNAVGSKQPDEIRSHNHSTNPNHPYMDNNGPGATNGCEGGNDVHYTPRHIAVTSTGGSETRPKNAYVYYIIKI